MDVSFRVACVLFHLYRGRGDRHFERAILAILGSIGDEVRVSAIGRLIVSLGQFLGHPECGVLEFGSIAC